MSIVMQYVDRIHEIFEKHADRRTTNWFMIRSPFPTLFICLSYVYFVKVLGPKLMENRKPFQLKKVLVAYNLFQMLFSAWLFYEIGMSGWLTGEYSLRCQPVDTSDRPMAIRMAHASWWYYISKFSEFMDTIFFILRKKNNHVSTLHVIHHGCMPMSVWFGVKFTPGGHSTFFGFLNTFVHIVMYMYYLLAALGPKMQPYLWWKKYLTVFQMIQFIAVMVHAFQLLFIDCNYPMAFVWWIGMHAVMFFFLFSEFYQESYRQKNKRTTMNGVSKKDHQQSNGLSNGSAGTAASTSFGRRDAADYYVKGDSLAASELNLRKSYATAE
ncbi:very long chain fatty acid elongase AAEL008004 [Nomia melanderi]|uniref:very long chain fatty acid elongase AAEL008004 n=1 Tax=Nomia melanderi TaxID=2448451 RepID=UPI0013046952|nr:elongation of very long chain fatty acids protein AAEL008004-like [Nomia melanderi]XP_031827282.1 elongation of very long chain fatty acids protein AAEL008004-like [Nomia melanderi]XP_031827283.1 elongation of very long chain fatty acids protein AAEL008004-like [Nomia melanderi]XP_031827284.1 elongation of very long chain fatty acids protein AAEL008004-like [Nomia melanderi]